MREKTREIGAESVEERGEERTPLRYGWPDSANDFAPESQPSTDRTITISVTKGRTRATHQLKTARASIGQVGGRADMQIDDDAVSFMHCAVAITENNVRLYDLDSENGIYVDDERVQVADLEHLSAFRIGSTELVVSIVSNCNS